MPSRSLNRRRFEVAADGHTGNCSRVAVFNGCNAALGQTGTFGHKQSVVMGCFGVSGRRYKTPIAALAPSSRPRRCQTRASNRLRP